MNILLISYGDLEYDGRLRSLIAVFKKMGKVNTFTRGKKLLTEQGKLCNASYPSFIWRSLCYAKNLNKIDLLVLDNRKATIPGLLINTFLHPERVIQDCRELYLVNEVKHFAGKVGCIFEKMMVRRADIVICANKERAEIMQQEYGLSKLPLVYENVRELTYASEDEKEKARKKFEPFIKEDELRIISTSGCSVSRTNDVLVKNLKNAKKKCRLFLVGSASAAEEKLIKDLAVQDKRNEVTITGRLNQTELKYLISLSHIGIVNYGQYDTNNKYCASGKLFEFLYEGIPIVTTTNPPLKRICEEEKVGVTDDGYADGINEVLNNYELYKANVERFTKKFTIAANDSILIKEIENTM